MFVKRYLELVTFARGLHLPHGKEVVPPPHLARGLIRRVPALQGERGGVYFSSDGMPKPVVRTAGTTVHNRLDQMDQMRGPLVSRAIRPMNDLDPCSALRMDIRRSEYGHTIRFCMGMATHLRVDDVHELGRHVPA